MQTPTAEVVLERMVGAVQDVRDRLLRATAALDAAKVAYAVIGGNAVAVWVARVDRAAVRNTQDVDILIRRSDLMTVREVLETAGFSYKVDQKGPKVPGPALRGGSGFGPHRVGPVPGTWFLIDLVRSRPTPVHRGGSCGSARRSGCPRPACSAHGRLVDQPDPRRDRASPRGQVGSILQGRGRSQRRSRTFSTAPHPSVRERLRPSAFAWGIWYLRPGPFLAQITP